MVITRKIQVYVNEADAEQKKQFVHTIYEWRDLVRKGANAVVAHKFVQQNVRDFAYIKDDIQEKFYVSDILKEGKGMSEQNTTYRVLSDMLKGKVPADIFSTLNQAIAKTFKEDLKDVMTGKASVRSYKNSIPIPFSGSKIRTTLKVNEEGKYIFSLFGIPMAMAFGRDRSNNQVMVDRCISGEYKLCSSSIQIDDKKKKMFVLLCFDVPKQEYVPVEGKTLFAFLGIETPITYVVDIKAKQEYDSGKRVFTIGTAEEFFHGRRQIQEAVKRCQVAMKYNNGGKGRKKKCKAIDHWHDKELNYVTTKMHTYSRLLVDAAVQNRCERIVLMKQKEREDESKEEVLVLRNWSYSGLKDKIAYKCKMCGIELKVE